jgi:hypothetical protein
MFAVGYGGIDQKKCHTRSFVRENLGHRVWSGAEPRRQGGGAKAHAHTSLLASLQPRV